MSSLSKNLACIGVYVAGLHDNPDMDKDASVASKAILGLAVSISECVVVPAKPTDAHLRSMAMRQRHDFGLLSPELQDSLVRNMRQLYEEATGQGFYKIPETLYGS